jgi:hypothetical protein
MLPTRALLTRNHVDQSNNIMSGYGDDQQGQGGDGGGYGGGNQGGGKLHPYITYPHALTSTQETMVDSKVAAAMEVGSFLLIILTIMNSC